VFNRSISAGWTFAGWFSSGMPVRKIVARSSRGASTFGKQVKAPDAPYSDATRLLKVVCRTKSRN
jgi:hypothetical protein